MKRCITEARRTEERSWLADASHSVLQQSVRDLSQAFQELVARQRQGACSELTRNAVTVKASAPAVRSFTRQRPGSGFPKIGVLRFAMVSAPAFRPLKCHDHQGMLREVLRLLRGGGGRKRSCRQPLRRLGLIWAWHPSLSTSDGEKFAPARFLRSALRKIGRLQRSLSRKVKGSRNRNKARLLLGQCPRESRRQASRLPAQTQHSAHPREPNGCAGGPECVRDAEEPASCQEHL